MDDGVQQKFPRPKTVVLASPALEATAVPLRKMLGCEEDGGAVSWEMFKSGDPNTRFNFTRLNGKRVVVLFDTVDRERLFEQLSLVQALQGFPVPDGSDAEHKWKTYAAEGTYSWGRAAEIVVVLPWYRPCQMERTSRWQKTGSGWTNADPSGDWLDVPTAQTLVRLLTVPGAQPPGPGPRAVLDGRPMQPLWVPPMELLFLELHEEEPVRRAVGGTGAHVRTERLVPHFLQQMQRKPSYAGKARTYILFPDRGAYDRYFRAVVDCLGLELDHILWIKKSRVGEDTKQVQKLFFDQGQGEPGEKLSFEEADSVLIIDDFTNSGGTLFGAVDLVRSKLSGGENPVSIFVSHLVAAYDPEVVKSLQSKLKKCGPRCHFYTTDTIPLTTNLLADNDQIEVISIVDVLAEKLESR